MAVVAEQVGGPLAEAIDRGLTECGRAIADFVGMDTTMRTRAVLLEAVLRVPGHYGDLDVTGAAAYVRMTGDVSGHCLLFLSEATAHALVRAAEASLGPLDEALADSMIHEFGNIAVSAFMTGLAAAGGWSILPTPPELAWTVRGAALQSLLGAMAAETDLALVVAAEWRLGGQDLDCGVLVLPDAQGLAAMLGAPAHGHA